MFYETLSQALEAEGLLELWPNTPINYGETVRHHVQDGKYGRLISIYRHDVTGRYETPVHYKTGVWRG
jgi:hypothetical protein